MCLPKGEEVKKQDVVKYLGIYVGNNPSWKPHTDSIRRKYLESLATLRCNSTYLSSWTEKLLYQTLILPHLDYCAVVYHQCSETLSNQIERIQNCSMSLRGSSWVGPLYKQEDILQPCYKSIDVSPDELLNACQPSLRQTLPLIIPKRGEPTNYISKDH